MSSCEKNNSRTNHALARIIEEGIRIDAVKGAANAWAYLQGHAVDPQTILRVLSGASSRRRDSRGTPAAFSGAMRG